MDLKGHFLYMYSGEFWYSTPDLEVLNRSGVDLYASASQTKSRDLPAACELTQNPESESSRGFFVTFCGQRLMARLGASGRFLWFESRSLDRVRNHHGCDRNPNNFAKTLRISV